VSDAATIAVEPLAEEGILDAIRRGGGEISDSSSARGLVWTNPADPRGLKDLIESNPIEWIQLPFAGIEDFGIEDFVAAGAVQEGRTWTCAKGTYGPACAEHAVALTLASARRLAHHARADTWRETGLGMPERRLDGSTVVLYGTGGIGGAVVPFMAPLGPRFIGVNRSGRPLEGAEKTVAAEDLISVLGEGDFVILSAAVTPETRKAFNEEVFSAMKDSAWLINVGRGALVDTDALVSALKNGEIAGAALDVTDPEPLPDEHPLWSMDNVLLTPHIANTWDMALPELRALVERNVKHFVRDEPLEGLVDLELGY
jgi:phosphoglycerate dehydrogenase-like enzyme